MPQDPGAPKLFYDLWLPFCKCLKYLLRTLSILVHWLEKVLAGLWFSMGVFFGVFCPPLPLPILYSTLGEDTLRCLETFYCHY